MATVICASSSLAGGCITCKLLQQPPRGILYTPAQVCLHGGLNLPSSKFVLDLDTRNRNFYFGASHKNKIQPGLRVATRTELDVEEPLSALEASGTEQNAATLLGSDVSVPKLTPDDATGLTSSDTVPSLVDGIDNSDITSSTGSSVVNSPVEDASGLTAPGGSFQEPAEQVSGAAVSVDGEPQSDILAAVKAGQDAVTQSYLQVETSVRDTFDSIGSAVKGSYDSANGAIVKVIKSVTGGYDKTSNDLQRQLDFSQGRFIDFTTPFRMGTPANNALKEAVRFVTSTTGTALEASGRAISQVYGSTKEVLPQDVQSLLLQAESAVSQVAEPFGSALHQVFVVVTDLERGAGIDPDNPAIPIVLVLGGTIILGLSYFRGQFGGYSGNLLPNAALEALKKDGNVVLVDIRPQDAKERDGVPDLRRRTRSKFASIEVVKVEGSLRSKLKNTSEVESMLTASVIRDLKNVNRSTMIIVLDANGSESKQIARGLRKLGLKKQYRVEGGFDGWTTAGLRTKPEGPAKPLTILKEDTEDIVEEVNPTPVGVFAVGTGLLAATYALTEWEKTLQLIGVIGIGQALYSRFNSYDSIEDAKADLSVLQRPFKLAMQGIFWLAGQVDPGKLQLATSPVSSAVQGRVIQAAAKHGPLASELDPETGSSTSVAEEVTSFDSNDSTSSHVAQVDNITLPSSSQEPQV